MSTLLPYDITSQYAAFGIVNQGFSLLTQVKQCISEYKEIMEREGLQNVYIDETERMPTVVIILNANYEMNYEFWRDIRERIRESGAEFVSNFYENDKTFELDDSMTKFI